MAAGFNSLLISVLLVMGFVKYCPKTGGALVSIAVSARAKEFAELMIRHHGHCSADRVTIPLSQREIARRYEISPGTLAWYLNQLGDVVVQRRPFIVLRRDVAVTEAELSPAAAVSANTLDDRLAALTDAIEVQCELLRMLLEPSRVRANESAERASDCANPLARLQREVQKEEVERLPSSSSREAVARTRECVERLLEPLDQLSRRNGLQPVGNRERLHRALAGLSDAEIAVGVRRLCSEIRRGAPVRSPFGLLIAKAESGEHDFFAPLVSATGAGTVPAIVDEPPSDDPTERILAAMEADPERWASELAALDRASIDYLHEKAPRGADRFVRNPSLRRAAQLDLLRKQHAQGVPT
jgi:transcriptional regulator with XRE-family HTH domain